MSKNIIDILFDRIFDDKWTGKFGEQLTENELKLVQLFGRKGKVLRNAYIPTENGSTSEIDVLFITQKGIFVFESKNYSGWIFGDEKNRFWTATLANGQKNQFYNPISQNRTHIKWLRKLVGESVPLFSIVVFSERCELKKITYDFQNVKIIKRSQTYATVREIWNKNPDCISGAKIDELYSVLIELTNVSENVKKEHVDRIQSAYVPYKTGNNLLCETTEPISADKNCTAKQPKASCPLCGQKLVLRVTKRGPHTGDSFWGCSNFPHCRYTQQIEKYNQM